MPSNLPRRENRRRWDHSDKKDAHMPEKTVVTSKRRVLVVGSASLFGCAVGGLLENRGDGFDVTSVKTVEAAIETAPKLQPDVIVFCLDRDDGRNGDALNRLR